MPLPWAPCPDLELLEIQRMSNTLVFDVKNMKCGGCVAAAESAVAKLPGVASASFDLDSATGTVIGTAEPQAVIDALTAEGYPASLRAD
jgi:copper chaperone CopZ